MHVGLEITSIMKNILSMIGNKGCLLIAYLFTSLNRVTHIKNLTVSHLSWRIAGFTLGSVHEFWYILLFMLFNLKMVWGSAFKYKNSIYFLFCLFVFNNSIPLLKRLMSNHIKYILEFVSYFLMGTLGLWRVFSG